MKKFKKLNRKGFTLIELLAVIVILAVVMGIAANSVLTSMNNARGGSLLDSAEIIRKDMINRLMSAQLDSTTGGAISGTTLKVGTTGTSVISIDLGKEFGLSNKDYMFGGTAPSTTATSQAATSFIYYDASDNSFVVCLRAAVGGKYDVASFRTAAAGTKNLVTLANSKFIQNVASSMIGCSNGNKTW